jgi:HEAT repeat protein
MRRSSLPRLGPCVAAFLLAAACTLTAPWGTPPARADASKDARKAFREALKSEHWKDRQEAYLRMADADGAEAVRAILDELSKEENPAVVLTGIGVLAGFESEPARALLVRELHKGRDATRMVVLLALERHEGDAAVPHLLEIVQGTDAPAAAQAALALGRKQVLTAVPHLVDLLRAKDWQCQRAAAVALRRLAQPPPPPPRPSPRRS